MLKRIGWGLFALVLASGAALGEQSRIPDKATYRAMLDVNAQTGWVIFQDEGNQQRLYFSPVAGMLCGLKEIRYSINSDALDQIFPLGTCIPQTPFVIDSRDPASILITYPKGTVQRVAVQVVFTDGEESEVRVYEPCENIGEQLCAWPVEE